MASSNSEVKEKLTLNPSMIADGAAICVILSATVAMMGLVTFTSGSGFRKGWKLSGRKG